MTDQKNFKVLAEAFQGMAERAQRDADNFTEQMRPLIQRLHDILNPSPLPSDEELAELAFEAAPPGGTLPGPGVARALVVYGMQLASNHAESLRANGMSRGEAFEAIRSLIAELETRS